MTQIGPDGNEHLISYFSKRLSQAEENYSGNDRKLLALVYFLQRFHCYVEGCEFEVLTDNQVLKYFFTKPNLSRQEAHWLDFLGQFGISQLTLIKGKIHVLEYVPSRAPHSRAAEHEPSVNTLHVVIPEVSLLEVFRGRYIEDSTFGDVFRILKGKNLQDNIREEKAKRMSRHCTLRDGLLYYDNLVCVPRKNIRDILFLGHDNKTAGHLGYSKTLSRLNGYN